MKITPVCLVFAAMCVTPLSWGATGMQKCAASSAESTAACEAAVAAAIEADPTWPERNPGFECQTYICARVPDHFCGVYTLDIVGIPGHGSATFYDDNCQEPDLTLPPPPDPLAPPTDKVTPPQCTN